MSIALFLSILLVAACGLIYELIAGTVASYLVGDSVFQFSTVIGTYLFAMGIGSFLSRYLHRQLATQFVRIELLIAIVGGFSSSAPRLGSPSSSTAAAPVRWTSPMRVPATGTGVSLPPGTPSDAMGTSSVPSRFTRYIE